jgi:mannan endo-1,4-beta-mannosidase
VKITLASGAPTGGEVQRPSYNTGDGFFVLNGKLYDANGNEFRIRGVNRCHFDSDAQPGISRSKANAVRMFMYELSYGAATYTNVLQNQHIAYDEVPIVSMAMFPDNTLTSGSQSTTELSADVAWWVANAKTFAPLSKYLIVNIANEWGPSNSTVWRDSYISAIAQMRDAGYTGPLLIDAGGYGQDPADIINYGAAVFNSDPQKNVIFSYHDYSPVSSLAFFPQFAALASKGIAVIIGEFGPGRDIGPSPTVLTPGQVITTAETNGLGWIAWAWDDNDLGNGKSDNNWFSMTYAGPGIYNVASDLTEYGQDVVLNSTYGLSVLATPASIFE